MRFAALPTSPEPRALTTGVSLAQLSRFLVLASELHFSRAAERLGISQPFLSEQIKALEASLGVQLFVRTSRQVSLTDAGKLLRSRVAAALQGLEDAFVAALEMQRSQSEPIRIGYSDEFVRHVLPELTGHLRWAHAAANLVLHPGNNKELRTALSQAAIDIALVCPIFEDPPEKDWEVIPFAPTTLMVGIPDDHRLAGADRLSLEDIADEEFLGSAEAQPSELESFIDRLFSQRGLVRTVTLRMNDTELLKGLAAAGAAIHLGPREDFETLRGITPIPTEPLVELSRGAILRAAPENLLLQVCRSFLIKNFRAKP